MKILLLILGLSLPTMGDFIEPLLGDVPFGGSIDTDIGIESIEAADLDPVLVEADMYQLWKGDIEDLNAEYVRAWVDLINDPPTPSKGPVWSPKNHLGVAEVRVPKSAEAQDALVDELLFFWHKEYSYCVFVLLGDESPAMVRVMAIGIQRSGWDVILAYGPPERKPEYSPYMKHPDSIKELIQAAAPYCKAIAPVWKGTAGFHWDDPTTQLAMHSIIANWAQEANANIAIFGELYEHRGRFQTLLPSYTTGVIGLNGVNPPSQYSDYLNTNPDHPVVWLSCGIPPYSQRQRAKPFWYKEKLFMKAVAKYPELYHCLLVGDASDHDVRGRTDNMSMSEWAE